MNTKRILIFNPFAEASAEARFSECIDMHDDREALCAGATALMSDEALHRDGLREHLVPHLDG